ncbi:MAG: NUDIX domain-containing protein [Parcubacteria group bacterium]|nr:NUDIX domain-containing protein [Parcubacteria group bacterium]
MTKISHDSETPAHGKQVITACALIHHNFNGVIKVFLPKRADTKKFLPGVFELPGGHIDFGEDIIKGLKREIMEEHGMRVTIGDPFAAFTYTNEIKGSHSIEVVYFAAFEDPIENIKLNREDHSEFRWVSQDDMGNLVSSDDVEMKNVKKGLALLNGQKPSFS